MTTSPTAAPAKHQHQAGQEGAPARTAAAAAASASSAAGDADAGSRLDVAVDHALAFDDALGDVARHLVGDRLDLGRFGQHHAPEPRVPEEAVGAAVAPHGDVADRVDPQARLRPGRDHEIEASVGGHVREDRRKFGGEQLEPHLLRLAQLDDHVLAVGGGVLDLADRIGEPQTTVGILLFGWIGHGRSLGSIMVKQRLP